MASRGELPSHRSPLAASASPALDATDTHSTNVVCGVFRVQVLCSTCPTCAQRQCVAKEPRAPIRCICPPYSFFLFPEIFLRLVETSKILRLKNDSQKSTSNTIAFSRFPTIVFFPLLIFLKNSQKFQKNPKNMKASISDFATRQSRHSRQWKKL